MPDRSQLRNALAELASRQSGYFTAAQARQLGYSYPQQSFHASRGNWLKVDRALFRLPHWPVGEHDDLVRACLWSRGRGVVSHESAALVHELAELDPLHTHLTVPRGFRARHPAVVLHVATLHPQEFEDREGYSVTTPLRTIVDLAAAGVDRDQLARAVCAAGQRGLVRLAELRRRSEEVDPRAALAIERALLEVREEPT